MKFSTFAIAIVGLGAVAAGSFPTFVAAAAVMAVDMGFSSPVGGSFSGMTEACLADNVPDFLTEDTCSTVISTLHQEAIVNDGFKSEGVLRGDEMVVYMLALKELYGHHVSGGERVKVECNFVPEAFRILCFASDGADKAVGMRRATGAHGLACVFSVAENCNPGVGRVAPCAEKIALLVADDSVKVYRQCNPRGSLVKCTGYTVKEEAPTSPGILFASFEPGCEAGCNTQADYTPIND